MPLLFETLVLLLVFFALGLGLGWLLWGNSGKAA